MSNGKQAKKSKIKIIAFTENRTMQVLLAFQPGASNHSATLKVIIYNDLLLNFCTAESPRAYEAKFYGRLWLIRSLMRASKFDLIHWSPPWYYDLVCSYKVL